MASIFRIIKALIFLLVLAVAGAGFLIYKRSGKLDLSFLEKTLPVIDSVTEPIGMGSDTRKLQFAIHDAGAGLDEVVVRIEQNGKTQDLFRKSYGPKTTDDTFEFDVQPKEKGLKEGEATIKISVFDKSFWNNATTQSFATMIDYSRPRVEVLTNQHNVAIGGVELVFYRIKGTQNAKSGVKVGDLFFEGSKASQLDPAFEQHPDVYFALFALPYNFNKDKDKISVIVENSVGNKGSSTINYLVIPRKYKDADMKLSDDFLRKVFDELLPPYYAEVMQTEPNFEFDSLTAPEKIEKFKLINESYRALLIKKIDAMLSTSVQQKLWTTPWNRPMAAAPTSTFAETRTYAYNGEYASTSLHAGVDLADVANAVVHPANAGKVIFADFLGIYGNAVIIDHGFGLATLYGHLSSISVSPGEMVESTTTIGRSGATGLAGGDHLHFEIRLHGVPVHPIEWWDSSWIREHIEKKIQAVIEQVQVQN